MQTAIDLVQSVALLVVAAGLILHVFKVWSWVRDRGDVAFHRTRDDYRKATFAEHSDLRQTVGVLCDHLNVDVVVVDAPVPVTTVEQRRVVKPRPPF